MLNKIKYAIIFIVVVLTFVISSYWLWLLLIVISILFFHISSKIILTIAMTFTLLGALLSITGLGAAGHILRIGFVFWITGYFLNLYEILRKK